MVTVSTGNGSTAHKTLITCILAGWVLLELSVVAYIIVLTIRKA